MNTIRRMLRYRYRRKLAYTSVLLCVVMGVLVVTEFYLSSLDTNTRRIDPFQFQGVRQPSNIHQVRSQTPDEQHGSYPQDRHLGQSPARNIDELVNTVVPNTVFFVWCDNRTFEYKHYLSVMSVWRFLEPDILEIHYKSLPIQDKYNDWLDLLTSSIPNLLLKELPSWISCEVCYEYVIDLLSDRGGVFVDTDTIILRSLHTVRKQPFTIYYSSSETPRLVFSAVGFSRLRDIRCLTKKEVFKKYESLDSSRMETCEESRGDLRNSTAAFDCFILSQPIYPKDILTQHFKMAAVLRYIAYSESEPISPSTDSTQIPKIIHYIWYNKADMTFMMYLSLLSSLHVIKAERVFVHGGDDLGGQYWDKVKVNPRVVTVHRDSPREVFGNQVLYSHHKSDIIRGDILYKYGGIYVDWDVLWLKPVDDLLSAGYDVIVDLDHMAHWPYPESINMGVVLSKPRTKYIKMWRNTYRKYRKNDFFYNPIEVPYKMYELYPDSVQIEPRLQVMCYQLMCHPIFHPQHKDFQSAQPFNWRTDVYSIHFTFPDPDEYKNESALHKGQGMFADIGKYILKAANLI